MPYVLEVSQGWFERHGVKAAIHTLSAEYANTMIDKGFDLVTLSNDYRHMVSRASEVLSQVKQR